MRQHIVFVHNVEFPQQGAVDVFYYAKYLSRYPDIKITVLVQKINQYIEHENLNVIEIGAMNYWGFVFKAFAYIRTLQHQEVIDYVYFFAQHPGSVVLQLLVKYALRIPTIYDVVSGPIGRGLIPWIAKHTIKTGVYLSDRYVVLDQGLHNKLKLSNNKPSLVIPMGYDGELFMPQADPHLFERQPGDIIFGYIGTLDKTRNLPVFVQAFVYNIEHYPHIKLYLIGSGNDEDAIKTIAQGYIDINIFLLGKRPHHLIPDYIASSDILVSYIPKIDYFEHQPPTKLIEYLACNRPVIATNTIAQSEILIDHPELIHADDLQSTIDKIDWMVTHLDELETKNYTDAVEQYSWEKLVDYLFRNTFM